MSKSVSNWHYKRPKAYYNKCIKLFGSPLFTANVRHGHALWKTRGLFTQHLLIDEDVKHCVPRPHRDYFYSSVLFFVPETKLCDVLKISGSLLYDGLKKELTARCGGIGANYATIYLAMLVASGKMSINDVKKQDMYPRMIRGEIIPHSEMAKKMMVLKRSNNKKYSKEIKQDFASFAYKECYNATTAKNAKKTTTKRSKNKKGGNGHKTMKLKLKTKPSVPINTRDESCYKNNMTTCCPHMTPDERGRYAATTKKENSSLNELMYRGNKYSLRTCCPMCAEQMKSLALENPDKFDKLYKLKMEDNGRTLLLANRHTGIYVQKLKRL